MSFDHLFKRSRQDASSLQQTNSLPQAVSQAASLQQAAFQAMQHREQPVNQPQQIAQQPVPALPRPQSSVEALYTKVNEWIRVIETRYTNVEKLIKGVFIGVITKGNVLFVGPPGVGKTSVAMDGLRAMGLKYAYIPGHGATTPEDLFGTLNPVELTKGRIEIIPRGFLTPGIDAVVFDEVSRIGPAAMSALMGIMDHRLRTVSYYGQEFRVEIAVIGTANWIPEDVEAEAFVKRFLRMWTSGALDTTRVITSLREQQQPVRQVMSRSDVDELRSIYANLFETITYYAGDAAKVIDNLVGTINIKPGGREIRMVVEAAAALMTLDGVQSPTPELIKEYVAEGALWAFPNTYDEYVKLEQQVSKYKSVATTSLEAALADIRTKLLSSGVLTSDDERQLKQIIIKSREIRTYALRKAIEIEQKAEMLLNISRKTNAIRL